jgi:tetratricopeptide (TPR) repeat protein
MALVRESKLDLVPGVLRQAARMNPDEDQLFRAWGAYYRARGDLERAAKYYRKAIEILYPDGVEFLEFDDDSVTLGDLYREIGDHKDAVDAYEQACFAYVCPDEKTTLNYGRELLALGRKDELKELIMMARPDRQHVADELQAESRR